MCFKVQGVMRELTAKKKEEAESSSDRSQRRMEERVKSNYLGENPSFPLHAWKAITEAVESLTTH